MSAEVGSAHVSVYPVMPGFKSSIAKEAQSAGVSGAKAVQGGFKSAGPDAGRTLGTGLKSAFGASVGDLGGASIAKLNATVASASSALSKARLKQQDDAGKVRVAEVKLQEAIDKSGSSSSQAVAAEERLAAARRVQQASTDAVTSASVRLTAAQEAVKVSATASAKAFTTLATSAEGGSSRVSSVASGLGRVLGTFGKVAGAAMLGAAAAVAAGVGAVVTKGVQFDAAMQNYTAAFTPLLGGADKAQAKLQELSAFAAATPFELSGLAQASQTLLSFGETSADLLPDLKMLGDISQGNQEKLSGLALVFGQVQSNGHLMGQDLLQMINQGFNPLPIIAQKTGESMDALRNRMSVGRVSFQEVKDAMVTATSAGGQFYGSMALGAKTLTGAWSSTQDGANILSGALVSKLTPSLTDSLNSGVNPLLGGLLDLVNGTDGAQAEVDAAVGSIVGSTQNLGSAITSIVGSIGTVVTALAPAVGNIVGTLVQSLVSILPSLVSVASKIVLTLVSAIVQAAPGFVATAVPILLSFVGGLLGQLPAIIGAGIQVLLALVNGMAAAAPTLIPQIVDALVQGIITIVDNLPALLQAGLALLEGIEQGLLGALPVLIAALPQIIVGIVTFLLSAGPQILEAAVQLLLALVEALPQIQIALAKALPQLITGIIDFFTTQAPQLNQMSVRAFMEIVKAVPQIAQAMVAAAPEILKSLIEGFAGPGAISDLKTSGMRMIQGLIDGIRSMIGQAKKAIGDVMGAIASFLPHSPALEGPFSGRGWTVYSGQAIGQGLADGMVSVAPTVAAGADFMMRAAAGAQSMRSDVEAYMTRFATTSSTLTTSLQSRPAALGGGLVINGDVYTQDVKEFADQMDTRARRAAALAGLGAIAGGAA